MSQNLHEGHRSRVRKEFLEHGFNENTPPHKILEMLLFYSIPRKDTNEIAHELLNTFGSINGVIDAPIDQLLKVNGVSENTVALLKLMVPIIDRYITKSSDKDKYFENIEQLADFLLRKYLGFTRETLVLVSLSGKGKMLGYDILSVGDTTSVEISIRKVLEVVMKRNPICVVLAHNHPMGNALPSSEDVNLTINLKETLENINVTLLDHIVIADNDYVSMSLSKQYSYIFNA